METKYVRHTSKQRESNGHRACIFRNCQSPDEFHSCKLPILNNRIVLEGIHTNAHNINTPLHTKWEVASSSQGRKAIKATAAARGTLATPLMMFNAVDDRQLTPDLDRSLRLAKKMWAKQTIKRMAVLVNPMMSTLAVDPRTPKSEMYGRNALHPCMHQHV